MTEVMSNEDWERKYGPISQPDGSGDPNSGTLMYTWDEAQAFPDNRVWSVVEEQGRQVVVAGRLRNSDCLDYAVTTHPWTTGEERGYWLPLEAEIDLGHISVILDRAPVHQFIVSVWGCTAEQAETVMAERIGPDEDYGFAYRIDWEAR